MKTKLFVTFAAAMLLGGLALAQSVTLEAKIPFDFLVGERTFAAGHYELVGGTMQHVTLIRRSDRSAAAFVITNGVSRSTRITDGKLQFNRYGDSYYLATIWSPGSDTGRQLVKSKREAELARSNTSRVEVAYVPLTVANGQ